MFRKDREALYLPIVAAAFRAEGLPPELGAAIVRQESDWHPEATVKTGGDAARGGAYGLCQMTLKTAQGLDRSASVASLLDPAYNCRLAAKLCRQNWERVAPRPNIWADVAAMYNSGKPLAKAPKATREKYVPAVLGFMETYRPQALALAIDLSTKHKAPKVKRAVKKD